MLIALQVAGVPLSQFAVFTGAIGVGLGFGMQAIFSNFVSGLILLFDRSLKVGDFIELDKAAERETFSVNDAKEEAQRESTSASAAAAVAPDPNR